MICCIIYISVNETINTVSSIPVRMTRLAWNYDVCAGQVMCLFFQSILSIIVLFNIEIDCVSIGYIYQWRTFSNSFIISSCSLTRLAFIRYVVIERSRWIGANHLTTLWRCIIKWLACTVCTNITCYVRFLDRT